MGPNWLIQPWVFPFRCTVSCTVSSFNFFCQILVVFLFLTLWKVSLGRFAHGFILAKAEKKNLCSCVNQLIPIKHVSWSPRGSNNKSFSIFIAVVQIKKRDFLFFTCCEFSRGRVTEETPSMCCSSVALWNHRLFQPPSRCGVLTLTSVDRPYGC